jgi:hypothetical protein
MNYDSFKLNEHTHAQIDVQTFIPRPEYVNLWKVFTQQVGLEVGLGLRLAISSTFADCYFWRRGNS